MSFDEDWEGEFKNKLRKIDDALREKEALLREKENLLQLLKAKRPLLEEGVGQRTDIEYVSPQQLIQAMEETLSVICDLDNSIPQTNQPSVQKQQPEEGTRQGKAILQHSRNTTTT